MIQVIFNGRAKDLGSTLTLEEFLNSLDVEIGYAAIAINREFVPRAEFAQVILQAGDKIECVMPMQGG